MNLNDILIQAVLMGHITTVRLMLKAGANVHADNDYALRRAVYNGHTDMVQLLLEHGADVHANDDQALRLAAENGHVDMMLLLLEYAAKLTWVTDLIQHKLQESQNGLSTTR